MPGRPDVPPETILILGGTAEAAKLAGALSEEGKARVITALAGRTDHPVLPPGEVRIGGFGGIDGLAAYLIAEGITQVIDATHPFARRISRNAVAACAKADVPLTVCSRKAWQRQPDDLWIEVDSLDEAVTALPEGATVFLALGRQHIDAFAKRGDCRFVIRMVDAPKQPLAFAVATIVLGKALADWQEERRLFEAHGIDHVVARNSGGDAGYGKIVAARELQLPVVMIGRPTPEDFERG